MNSILEGSFFISAFLASFKIHLINEIHFGSIE